MNAPKEIIAGFNVEWIESPAEYSSSSYGLSATFTLLTSGAVRYTVDAIADGTGFRFTIPAATTAGYTAGNYRIYLYATSGLAKYLIGQATLVIRPNPLTATGDTREHNQKMLDAINATLEGRATQEYASMTINGYSVSQMPPDELLRLRSYYKNEIRKADNADRIASGKPVINKILTKFQ